MRSLGRLFPAHQGAGRTGVGLLALLIVAPACSQHEGVSGGPVVYAAYEGEPPFPNRRQPLALPTGDFALTSDNGSDTITALDLDARRVLATAGVGRDPIDNDGPHHLAVDTAGAVVYVALAYPARTLAAGPHAAHGSATRVGYVRKLSLHDLRPLAEARVDTNPGDVALSDDGGRLVVSHFDLNRALDRSLAAEERRADLVVFEAPALDEETLPAPRRVPVCVAPHGVALSRPDGRMAFVACYGEDTIAIADLADEAVSVVRVQVGLGAGAPGAPRFGPYSVALSPDGGRLAVGNTEARDVRFLDVATQTMDAVVVRTRGSPYFSAWSHDGARLFVPTQGPDEVLVVDPVSGGVVARRGLDVDTCERPHEAALGSDGRRLYVVCEGDHRTPSAVLVLDPDSLETIDRIGVGIYPDRVVIARAP